MHILMFSEDFSIFIGPSSVGKTTLLHRLAYEAKLHLGLKIAFIGMVEDEYGSAFLKNRYEVLRYIGYDDRNNRMSLESISQQCSSGDIDMVFIDDIDMFMSTDPVARLEYLSIIESICVSKLAVCSTFPFLDEEYEYTIDNFRCYSLACEHEWNTNGIPSWSYQVDGVDWKDFISSIIRDKKINDILR